MSVTGGREGLHLHVAGSQQEPREVSDERSLDGTATLPHKWRRWCSELGPLTAVCTGCPAEGLRIGCSPKRYRPVQLPTRPRRILPRNRPSRISMSMCLPKPEPRAPNGVGLLTKEAAACPRRALTPPSALEGPLDKRRKRAPRPADACTRSANGQRPRAAPVMAFVSGRGEDEFPIPSNGAVSAATPGAPGCQNRAARQPLGGRTRLHRGRSHFSEIPCCRLSPAEQVSLVLGRRECRGASSRAGPWRTPEAGTTSVAPRDPPLELGCPETSTCQRHRPRPCLCRRTGHPPPAQLATTA